ncbi:hypothetical protein KNE206_65920 [Kitasatospora sp. NE20-6]|uniref:DUF6087 family protein n=1 Tax=Kitasatospora sp. NE20-6 TaxID=2859066 RepID=UPI0034DC63F5
MFVPGEEPLPDRYADRAGLKPPVGTRDAVVLDGVSRPGGHPLFQDGPRLVVEWDGRTWQPVAVADTYVAACQMITADGRPPLFPQAQPPTAPLRRDTDRPGQH